MALARLYFRALLGAAALLACGPGALAQAATQSQGAGGTGQAGGAGAGWSLCNRTSYVIEAAVGHYQGQGTTVEGWRRLRPGACGLALAGPLEPGLHYLFARSSTAHRGGRQVWGGETRFCVDPTGSFSVESPPDCASMGLEARDFQPVLIESATGWRTTFTETETYSREEAAAAGIQRLLGDAGVFSGKIDGDVGRRTRAAIGEFLKQNELDAETSDDDLVDVLEQIAQEHARDTGLTLCNRTRSRIWTAIARRKGEGWESRGWWLLETGGCARAIDAPLPATTNFVFAEMETPDGRMRQLKQATDPFCLARTRFAINGRKNCEASAHRTGLFKATPPARDRHLLYEFFDRDFKAAGK